jgi:hypothetical protein
VQEIAAQRAAGHACSPLRARRACPAAASANSGTILDAGGASIIYLPPAGFVEVDRFSFSILDESFAEATGEVEVEVVAAGP